MTQVETNDEETKKAMALMGETAARLVLSQNDIGQVAFIEALVIEALKQDGSRRAYAGEDFLRRVRDGIEAGLPVGG